MYNCGTIVCNCNLVAKLIKKYNYFKQEAQKTIQLKVLREEWRNDKKDF